MTILERKECDAKELSMWDRGYRVGVVFGAAVAVIVICSAAALVWVLLGWGFF